jgi:hypothetical protein
MIRTGFSFEHPVSRTRTVVLECDAETGGLGWLVEVTRVTTEWPDLGEHLHTSWTETFEIVSGCALYRLAGAEEMARAGECFVVLPGQLHIHPWNADGARLVYRQRTRFAAPNPKAVQEILGVFATRAGMLRDGIEPTSRFGQLMQSAATLRTAVRHGNFMAAPSIAVQKTIATALGPLAERLGYRAVHPKYVGE